MEKKNTTAILFVCHIFNGEAIRRYNAIRDTMPEGYEVFWAYDRDIGENSHDINFFLFKWEDYRKKYNDEPFTSGRFLNLIYPVIDFNDRYRGVYKDVLYIEYDVVPYRYNWKPLLEFIKTKDEDLILANTWDISDSYYLSYMYKHSEIRDEKKMAYCQIMRLTPELIDKLEAIHREQLIYFEISVIECCMGNNMKYLKLFDTPFVNEEYFCFLPVFYHYPPFLKEGQISHPCKIKTEA